MISLISLKVKSSLEGILLGNKQTLDLKSIDFDKELHPKVYARDYVNAIQAVEYCFVLPSLIKEEELILGKREITSHRTEPKKITQLSVSITDNIVPGEESEESRMVVLKTFKSYTKEEDEMDILISHIKILFEQKPVWQKSSLELELHKKGIKYASDFSLKKALATITYLFKNGPWKFTYTRFGYDPRKEKKSLAYQTFNVGVGNRNFLTDTKITESNQ